MTFFLVFFSFICPISLSVSPYSLMSKPSLLYNSFILDLHYYFFLHSWPKLPIGSTTSFYLNDVPAMHTPRKSNNDPKPAMARFFFPVMDASLRRLAPLQTLQTRLRMSTRTGQAQILPGSGPASSMWTELLQNSPGLDRVKSA